MTPTTRRQFVKSTGMAGVFTLLAPATITAMFTTGCSVNVKGLLNTVIASITAILKVAESGAPWATTLSTALIALQAAEATWSSGGAVTLVIDALDTIENVLAVIPETAIYSPLIAILVAGITAVLNALPVSAKLNTKVTLSHNSYMGKVMLKSPRFYQTHQGAYKAQWNEVADGLGLQAAKI